MSLHRSLAEGSLALLLLTLLAACSEPEPVEPPGPPPPPKIGEGTLGVAMTRHTVRLVPMAAGLSEEDKLTELQRGRSINVDVLPEAGFAERLKAELGTGVPGKEAYYQFPADAPFAAVHTVLEVSERAGHSRQVLVLRASNGRPSVRTLWPVAVGGHGLVVRLTVTGAELIVAGESLGAVPCADRQGTELERCGDVRTYDWTTIGSAFTVQRARAPDATELTVEVGADVPWGVVSQLLPQVPQDNVVLELAKPE